MSRENLSERVVRRGNLTVSLQTSLFAIFVSACASRWLARYGLGVGVMLAWCLVIGALVGLIIGALRVMTDVLRGTVQMGRTDSPFAIMIRCTLAGALAALVGGALGFAAAAPGQIRFVAARGAWFNAVTASVPLPHNVTKELTLFVFPTAVVAAVANSIACVVRTMTKSNFRFLGVVTVATAMAAGLIPTATLVIAVLHQEAKSHGPGYESMAGLLPLAAALWFAIGAAVGLTSGAFIAALWLWVEHTNVNRLSWSVFWCTVTFFVLLLTEVGLHGLLMDTGWQ